MVSRSAVVFPSGITSVGTDETALSGDFTSLVSKLGIYFTQLANGGEVDNTIFPFSYVQGSSKTESGKPDFTFQCDNKVIVVGELKPTTFNASDGDMETIASDEQKAKRQKLAKEGAKSTTVAPIRQTLGYMMLTNLLFGILTTYRLTWFFIRDCQGHAVVVGSFQWDRRQSQNYMSVPQALLVFLTIASKGRLPKDLEEKTHLVQCKEGCDHCVKEESSAQTQTVGMCMVFVDFSAAYTVIGSGRTGKSYRQIAPRGKDFVSKVADVVKQPEMKGELDHEADMYSMMKKLQGKCIPEFLGVGSHPWSSILYTLSTSYEGVPICDVEDGLFPEEEASALDALKELHMLGVLHGDIRADNILVKREDPSKPGKVCLIDFAFSSPSSSAEDAQAEVEQLSMLLSSLRRQTTAGKPSPGSEPDERDRGPTL